MIRSDVFTFAHLYTQNVDSDYRYVFDRNVWADLIRFALPRAKWVEFSCFEEETSKIAQIQSIMPDAKCTLDWRKEAEIHGYDPNIMAHQMNYRGNINSEVVRLLTENYMEQGDIKWFDVMLTSEDDNESVLFAGCHSGTEYYINRIDPHDIPRLEEIARKYGLSISFQTNEPMDDRFPCFGYV